MNTVRYFVDQKDTAIVAGSKKFVNHIRQCGIIYRYVASLLSVAHCLPSTEEPLSLNFRFKAVVIETESQKDFSSGHRCCCFSTHKSTLKAFSYLLSPRECDIIDHFIFPSSTISSIPSFHRYFSYKEKCLFYTLTFFGLGQQQSNVVTYLTGVNLCCRTKFKR